MANNRQVVIVGAGALGLSCADHLMRRPGVAVTVVDKAFPGSGSSGLSVGIFTRQYMDLPSLEVRCRAVDQLEGYERDLGLDLSRIGFVRLARRPEDVAAFEGSVEMQRDLGVEGTRVLEPDELKKIVPDFDASGVIAALYCPTDGYMDGAQFCTVLAERVQELGGELRVRTEVTGIAKGVGTKYTVQTDKGEIPADLIVNATGAWGGRVGEALETPVDVFNERHEVYTFYLPEVPEQPFPMTMDYVAGSNEYGLFFRQEGDRQLLAGLHTNEILGDNVTDPDDYFRGVGRDNVEAIVERLAVALPGLEDIGYQNGWAGLYPHSAEDRLVLGPHPDNPDVIVGAGLGGIGLSQAPALGEILADWVTAGEPVCLPWTKKFAPRPR
jgi:sarcosine oxidase subunit beta